MNKPSAQLPSLPTSLEALRASFAQARPPSAPVRMPPPSGRAPSQPRRISMESLAIGLPPAPRPVVTPTRPSVPYQQPSFPKERAQIRGSERVSHLTKLLPPSQVNISTYVDLGAGNAEITAEIARVYSVETAYAVDVYPERNFKQPTPTSRILYRQIENNMIDLPSESVDLVTAFVLIHHVENFGALLKEIYRILKPGGWFFIREHDVTSPELAKFLDEYHLKFGHGQTIGKTYYWSRADLDRFIKSYGFKHISDSNYTVRNPQAIYHTLYRK